MEFMAALRGDFDDQKPSLFEILSEQQLNDLIPPSLLYLLTVATHRYPRYLLRIRNSFDELYALSALVIEHHYLRTRGGTFTEHFYGLKRERALPTGPLPRASLGAAAVVRDTLKLRTADIWANLAIAVGIPYLRRKLNEAHEVEAPRALLGSAYTQLPSNPTLKQRLLFYYRWFLRHIYPSVNAALGFAVLAFNLGYMFDSTKFHNPLMWLIGTRVRRMTAADYRAIEELTNSPPPAKGAAPGPRSILAPSRWGAGALASLSVALPMSIFALKFLEWWHASDFAKQLARKATDSLEIPPPIAAGLAGGAPKGILKKKESGELRTEGRAVEKQVSTAEDAPVAASSLLPICTVPKPADSSLCPICEEEVATPTACSTGVVYCYTCIHRWVAGQHAKQETFMMGKEGKWESGLGRCAVTGRRVLGGTEGLRRIII